MKKTILSLSLALIFMSVSASADITRKRPTVEFFTGSFASLDLMSGSNYSSGGVTSGSVITPAALANPMLGAMPRVGIFLSDDIEGIFTFGVSSASQGPAVQHNRLLYHFLFGVNYNLDRNNIRNSAFVEAKIGFGDASNMALADTILLGTLGVGKRFEIVNNIAYAPQVDFKIRSAGKSTAGNKAVFGLSFIPLQFSLLL